MADEFRLDLRGGGKRGSADSSRRAEKLLGVCTHGAGALAEGAWEDNKGDKDPSDAIGCEPPPGG